MNPGTRSFLAPSWPAHSRNNIAAPGSQAVSIHVVPSLAGGTLALPCSGPAFPWLVMRAKTEARRGETRPLVTRTRRRARNSFTLRAESNSENWGAGRDLRSRRRNSRGYRTGRRLERDWVRRKRLDSMASAAESFRSTWGSERGAPEWRRQRSPTATPQVGQGTEESCADVRSFIRMRREYDKKNGKAVRFGTLWEEYLAPAHGGPGK
jgi:hypothetical protein